MASIKRSASCADDRRGGKSQLDCDASRPRTVDSGGVRYCCACRSVCVDGDSRSGGCATCYEGDTAKQVCQQTATGTKVKVKLAATTTAASECQSQKLVTTIKCHSAAKSGFLGKLFSLLIINTVLSHLDQLDLSYIIEPNDSKLTQQCGKIITLQKAFSLPQIMLAGAIECALDGDCGNRDKICHDNKCICTREKPIEDQDRCLPLALIGEQCALSEQCLGNSHCLDGVCSCGNEAISLFNPSTRIFYCHPKRRLNEECNYDSQCPLNSYCSTNKFGCLCHNGYAPATVSNLGIESQECLAKFCSDSSSCESEFHRCDDNKCKCLATHFDPTSAKCYKFGSTGGKPADDLDGMEGNATTSSVGDDNNLYSIIKDLTENSDRLWLVLIILISLSILLVVLIFMLVRKYYLGYCWTAHKNEYEPNNKNQPKNGYFNKNSINNKSFRQKNVEVDEDGDDGSAEDASNLVTASGKTGGYMNRSAFVAPSDSHRGYVKVNINDRNNSANNGAATDNRYRYQTVSPLITSTSTPV